MTDDYRTLQRTLAGPLEDGLEFAGRTRNVQLFGDGVFRHSGFRCKIMAL